VCDWLISRARGRTKRAKVMLSYGGAPIDHPDRSNSSLVLDIAGADVVACLLRARIAAFVGLPTVCFEQPQVLHYAVGEEYRPHVDYMQRGPAATSDDQGERIMTFLLYLNDGYAGGETDFLHAGLSYKGARGDALAFANVDPAGRPDPSTLHAGRAVTQGEKWVLSQWIRNRPFGEARVAG
jgi:prolyl 4-hydroxylase